MKIQLRKIIDAKPALEKLLNYALPIKTAYGLKRLVRAVNSELTEFETERVALVKKLGQENEKGDFNVKPDNVEVFTTDLNSLLDCEVDIPYEPIPISSLGDVLISPVECEQLDCFFVE
jgi:hypothetical protein